MGLIIFAIESSVCRGQGSERRVAAVAALAPQIVQQLYEPPTLLGTLNYNPNMYRPYYTIVVSIIFSIIPIPIPIVIYYRHDRYF